MKSTTLETIAETLLKSVVIGGEVCRAERSRASVGFKSFEAALTLLACLASGTVTSADLAVQETILRFLLEQGFQDCAIQAEEDTPSLQYFTGDCTVATIYVDPIDGTLAYSMGCPGWQEAALSAGFNQEILVYSRERIDQQLYGMVLGAFVPGSGIAAVCVLPEVGNYLSCIERHSISKRLRNPDFVYTANVPGCNRETASGPEWNCIYSFCQCWV